MGVFSRLGRIIKSNLNSILDAAEDPEKSINQLLIEMRSNQREAKEQVAQAMVDEKKLQRKLQESQKKAVEWKQKAKLAVQRGDDDLAKQALGRAKAEAEMAKEYAKSAEVQRRAVENLKVALKTLDKKIEEAKRKKHVLLARKKTAEASAKIGTTVSSIKVDTDAFNEFDRLSEKIEDMEVKAGIMLEMNTDALEAKFEEESERDELDDELDALKFELGVAGTSHQLTEDAGKKKRRARRRRAAEEGEDLEVDEEEIEVDDLDELEDEDGEDEPPPAPRRKKKAARAKKAARRRREAAPPPEEDVEDSPDDGELDVEVDGA